MSMEYRLFPCSQYSCLSSGILSSSGAIKVTPGILVGVLAYTDGANDVTVTIYDNSSAAAGTVLSKIVVPGADKTGGEVNIMCEARTGIYMSISGTGATALIRYV